jgi:Na+(H+)/acetate symporter ActP
MLHQELYGLPHQKVVFASVVDVQEARKAWIFALINDLDPRLNR